MTVMLLTAAVCVLLYSSWDCVSAAAGPARQAQPLSLAAAAAAAVHPPASRTAAPGRVAESEAQAAAWREQEAFCDGLASLDFGLQTVDVSWLAPEKPTPAAGSAARRRRRRRLLLLPERRAAAGEPAAAEQRYWRRRLAQDAGRTTLAARGGMQTELPFGNSEVFTMYHHQVGHLQAPGRHKPPGVEGPDGRERGRLFPGKRHRQRRGGGQGGVGAVGDAPPRTQNARIRRGEMWDESARAWAGGGCSAAAERFSQRKEHRTLGPAERQSPSGW